MARFDRRTNYPLQDPNDVSDIGILTDAFANATLSPVRVGGVIKSRGPSNIPPNRVAHFLKHPYLYKVGWAKYTKGSGPRSWGSRLL